MFVEFSGNTRSPNLRKNVAHPVAAAQGARAEDPAEVQNLAEVPPLRRACRCTENQHNYAATGSPHLLCMALA